jgi:hypothetical protein
MTVREGSAGDKHPYLSSWKLVIALVVVAIVALVTLWLTNSPEAVVVVVAPFLLILGVDHYRR